MSLPADSAVVPPLSNGSDDDLPDLIGGDPEDDYEGNESSEEDPGSSASDPHAWNLETPIPMDLDTQDEFPDLLLPLFDYGKLGASQHYPKPELRDNVLKRCAEYAAQAKKEPTGAKLQPSSAGESVSSRGVKRTYQETVGKTAQEPGRQSAHTSSSNRNVCRFTCENKRFIGHALRFVGDAQCTVDNTAVYLVRSCRRRCIRTAKH